MCTAIRAWDLVGADVCFGAEVPRFAHTTFIHALPCRHVNGSFCDLHSCYGCLQVMANQADLVEVVHRLHPLLNVKGF